MPRPASVFSWAASGGAYIAAIPSAIRSLGFVPFSTSVAEYVNQALNDVGDWIDFFQAFHPQDGYLDVERITGTGSVTGLLITTDGPSKTVAILPQADCPISMQTSGTGTIDIISSTTVSVTGDVDADFGTFVGTTRTGLQVDHANRRVRINGGIGVNSANFRVPYQSSAPLSLTLPMWPGLGGWTHIYDGTSAVGDFEEMILTDGFLVENVGGGTTRNMDLRRSLPGIAGNAEASSTIYRLTAVTSVWGTGGAVDPDVEIVERLRASPYTETVIATVNGGAPTFTGSVALTPQTHDYYARLVATIPAPNDRTRSVRSLFVTVSKTAVE